MPDRTSYAVDIAKQAGAFLRSVRERSSNVRYKRNPDDPVTDADVESERMLVQAIRDRFPDDGIISEEMGAENVDSEYLWILDPLDGTNNFISGDGAFCVNIAILRKGTLMFGITYDVTNDEVHTGTTTTPYLWKDKILLILNNDPMLRKRLEGINVDNVVIASPTSLCLAAVASGQAAGAVKLSYQPWDVLPGVYLANKTGCITTTSSGKELKVSLERNNEGIVLARDRDAHDEILRILDDKA